MDREGREGVVLEGEAGEGEGMEGSAWVVPAGISPSIWIPATELSRVVVLAVLAVLDVR